MSFPQATRLLPGLALCLVVAGSAYPVAEALRRSLGPASLEPLVLAILIGIAVKTVFGTRPAQERGIEFSAKALLEIAIVLLGATVNLAAIGRTGAVVIAVVLAIAQVHGGTASYATVGGGACFSMILQRSSGNTKRREKQL